MVAKLVLGAGGTSTNADVNAFLALTTAEQQLIYLCDRAVAAQLAYNTTDPAPDPLINRVAVVPSANGMAAQMNAPLADDAVTGLLWDGCVTLGVGETPLEGEAGDSFTDPAMSDLMTIATLPGQIVYLAALIDSSESGYNTANPETPENRIQVAPNFDQKAIAVSALFPLAGSGNAALVGALPY